MRIEQIIAAVARVFAIVEVRTNRVADVFVAALRLHSWQLLMSHHGDSGYGMASCRPLDGNVLATLAAISGRPRLALVTCKPALMSSGKPSC